MNNVYFSCHTCKSFIDAGYRNIVTREAPVSTRAVLAYSDHWSADEPSVVSQLAAVRRYLEADEAHHVLYGELEDLFEGNAFLDWRCEDPNSVHLVELVKAASTRPW